jgi:hypothetical protein
MISVGASASSGSGSGSVTASASTSVFQVPVSLSYLWGGDNHFLEILGGADVVFASASGSASSSSSSSSSPSLTDTVANGTILLQGGLGYAYWPLDGGFHFRAMLYGMYGASTFFPWLGLTVGYAF